MIDLRKKTKPSTVKLFAIPVLILAFMFLAIYSAGAQTIATIVSKDRVLKDTVIKEVSYKLYVGSKGGRYVLRTSKSGNMYKQYISAKKKD